MNDKHLPRALYAVLALLCAVLGLWASIITFRYFRHGAMALEADPVAQALAVSAAVMLVAVEMGAFSLAGLLPAQKLWAVRWKLLALAGAVLLLEVFTIVAVQMALTQGAEMSQQATAQRAQDLRRQITQAETEAAALRAQSGQLASAEHAWVKAGAPKLAAMAASATAKTDGLYAELAKVDGAKHPTLVGLLGEDWALAYAVARGLLISCAGLVFWGAAGVLWRVFSAGDHSPVLQAVQAVQPPAVAPAVAPAVPPVWKPWTWSAAVPLALGAVAGVPSAAHASAADVAQVSKPQKAKPAVREVQPQKVDTGTGDRDGSRYRRVRDAVKAGSLRPSIPAIQKAEGGSYRTVTGYLDQMAADGLIRKHPSGRGWVLATQELNLEPQAAPQG